ncbi:tRNA dihydrouridine synthase DusB [Polycyclovorans algicola]|uniref:tRNA dihydrouridine synthase DusB n=1 Tax=Polycyclovorans algicola TaxID=616992 RepID=UPI0005BE35EA|nr:tRNA dihydrouridine synthase DusB [Polycyclovorans algicola]
MQIGPYTLNGQVMLAPMAGVTDRPFRQLARHFGAALATSEMTSADPTLWQTEKSRLRRDHEGEAGPISVQIAGYCPDMLAEAARFNVDHGAQIIDINLGCPAKKVCRVDAGSALMRDPALVRAICEAVVAAVPVPVTLKMRTGYCPQQKNALALALMAEASGIQALAIHGRTRDQQYNGAAEHETVALIKSQVDIPVIANGDLDTPQRCDQVLRATGCDAVMLGRAAQGRPWIFAEINHFLATGVQVPPPDVSTLAAAFLGHLDALYAFYGEPRGVRVARKHIGWTCRSLPRGETFWQAVRTLDDAAQQRATVEDFFKQACTLAPTRMAA